MQRAVGYGWAEAYGGRMESAPNRPVTLSQVASEHLQPAVVMAEVFPVICGARDAGMEHGLLIDRTGAACVTLFDEYMGFDQVSPAIDLNVMVDWNHVFNSTHWRAPWRLCRRTEKDVPDFGLFILHYLHTHHPFDETRCPRFWPFSWYLSPVYRLWQSCPSSNNRTKPARRELVAG